ncbi:MAG TPA: aspartate aminotransferase family protein [Solirubrobacteraceae bacterium]|jgi:ornithine--oxo-acid transaminase|nr:aspartate aminotransferase family protein [Solirubrobacteraceae bacterium]
MPEIPPVSEILATRAGEEMVLNDAHLNPKLGRIVRTLGFDRRWVRGEGAHLIDERGDRYLDLLSGYGVFAIGRNHPEAIAALRETLAAQTPNMPQLGVSLLSGVLAEQLLARAPGSVAAMVPANSGTESVEAAIKIARAATGRPRILYAEHAFHGLTLGSLSLNGDAIFREGFGPLLADCQAVPFGDLGALERALAAPGAVRSDAMSSGPLSSGPLSSGASRAGRERSGPASSGGKTSAGGRRGPESDVAAFVVEPVQGKGVNVAPEGYLQGAQRLCREAGALLVCDEVQTGLGRTGRFFALEHWGVQPDLICVSKALSGGLVPIGAVLVSRAAFDAVFDGMERAVRHGSTFGGNDLAAAAALATLRVIETEGLVARAERLGALLLELTRPLVERYEVVRDVRGLGLMWAIELGAPAGGARRSLWRATERAQPGIFSQLIVGPLFHRHRILCQVAGHRMNVIKALPALVVQEQEIRGFAAALEEVVASAERLPSAFARFGVQAGWRALAGR